MLLDYAIIFEPLLYEGKDMNDMNDKQEILGEVKQRLAEIDSQMRVSLGTDAALRESQYRQKSSLERRFMKQIVTATSGLLERFDLKQVMEVINETVYHHEREYPLLQGWDESELNVQIDA